MKHQSYIVKEYLKYLLQAKNLHGLHSPFAYSFNDEVLNDDRPFYAYQQIEQLRVELLKNNTLLEVEDYGAGSHKSNNKQRSIASITMHAAKTKKDGELLFRIMNYYPFKTAIELGTSMGIGAAYLASGNSNASIHTIEGSPAIAAQAQSNFKQLALNNIHQHIGKFDEVLPNLLQQLGNIDLLFIDGNHAYEPTLRYFEMAWPYMSQQSVLIFDDIHWSPNMNKAWEQIKNDSRVLLSIDVFQFGLVFINPDFKTKQHFVIRRKFY
jgi:predicted O-methyltransferase YrrM